MKKRLSNFELLRLLAMLFILLNHCNYMCLGRVDCDDVVTNPSLSFFRIFFEQAFLVGVNIFILISGWFGIKFTPKGVFALLFKVIFIGWLVCGLLFPFTHYIPFHDMFRLSWLGSYYWFVPSYLVLFVCSPALNAFAETADRKTLRTFLLFFFIIEFALGWLWDWENFGLGHSALSFIGLYLLARYVRNNSDTLAWANLSKIKYMIPYVLLTIIPTIFVFFSLTKYNWSGSSLSDASPFVIGGAMSVFLLFRKINMGSNRIVNWCASSAFSMYLIQMHPMVWPFWETKMNLLYEQYGGGYLLIAVVVCLAFSMICIPIDKISTIVWERLLQLYEHINKRI